MGELPDQSVIRAYIRKNASSFLDKKNVTSVGFGFKEVGGNITADKCIKFTVGQKFSLQTLETEGEDPLPKSVEIGGVTIPTDVVVRNFSQGAREIRIDAQIEAADKRKGVANPVVPGVSIGHCSITAGTAGCVVYDASNGKPYILSNWHVLNGASGSTGDNIVQPGMKDDNTRDKNIIGHLVRSYLGIAGDCAVASIDYREFSPVILDLNTEVGRVGEPELGDIVVKSGRTTGITYGKVTRVDTVVRLDYDTGPTDVGCFEIGIDENHKPADGEISRGGDSGSVWMFVEGDKTTDMMLGLHFAGNAGSACEYSLACYATSVFEKLNIYPKPKATPETSQAEGEGYQINFLDSPVAIPAFVSEKTAGDVLEVDGRKVIDYTHFSLSMSKSRKFAIWVAWNIDGGTMRKLSRKNMKFRADDRLEPQDQAGDDLYSNNRLDRGHIARRADLCWGSDYEAQKANRDSFYFTNITPQHERFNQSNRNPQVGIWGNLENAIFDDAQVEGLKVSVMGGPIFTDDDPEYRGYKIPKSFWKVIYYRDKDSWQVKSKSFVLTQENLLNQLEVLELQDFAVYEVPVETLSRMTGLGFQDIPKPEAESVAEIRMIDDSSEISW